MAATGYTPISLYYSTTASAVPTAGNLANGELALNIADMKLYAKNSAGTVTLLASNASTTGVDSLSFGSTGLTPSTATTGAITVAGTLNVANGGTGLTSLTANRIPYGNGTSALQSSGNLTFDGTRVTVLYSGASSATFGGNQAIRIDSNANTGYAIGIPSTGGIVGGYYINSGANTYDGGFDYNGTTRSLFLRSAGSTNATLDSAGNLGLGTTPSAVGSYKVMEINGTTGGLLYMQSTGTRVMQLYGASTEGGLWVIANGALTFGTNNTERFRFGASGQFGIGGANYGTAGQVLTSGGSGSAPTWSTAGGGTTMLFCAFSTVGSDWYGSGGF